MPTVYFVNPAEKSVEVRDLDFPGLLPAARQFVGEDLGHATMAVHCRAGTVAGNFHDDWGRYRGYQSGIQIAGYAYPILGPSVFYAEALTFEDEAPRLVDYPVEIGAGATIGWIE